MAKKSAFAPPRVKKRAFAPSALKNQAICTPSRFFVSKLGGIFTLKRKTA